MTRFKFDEPSECLYSNTISYKESGLLLTANVAVMIGDTAEAVMKSNMSRPSIQSRTPSRDVE
jgi:hypothetical protein